MSRRYSRVMLALLAIVSCSFAAAGPAGAAVGKRYVSSHFPGTSRGLISWNASCNADGSGSYAPSWNGYMQELGVSKVKSLMMEYDLYTPGTGLDTIRYQGASYVKSVVEYGTFKGNTKSSATLDQYLDPLAKTLRSRAITGDVLMVIKFTFNRGLLRKDTVAKQVVAFCSPAGFGPGET